jgi:hypothetical protein
VPRESNEWVGPIVVTNNNVPIAHTSWKWQIVLQGEGESGTWLDPLENPLVVGEWGAWADPLLEDDDGTYKIWVQITATGQTPVISDAGTLIRT